MFGRIRIKHEQRLEISISYFATRQSVSSKHNKAEHSILCISGILTRITFITNG